MSDRISVLPQTVTGLEPEEAPVERSIAIEAPVQVGHGGPAGDGEVVGQLPASIITSNTAGVLARNVSRNCSTCKHFDRKTMQDMIRRSDHPAAPLAAREAVNAIRASLLMTQNAEMFPPPGKDGDADVETAMMNDLGLCQALTSIEKDDVGVHQLSWCPDQYRSVSNPDGMWSPKGGEAKRAAAKGFDAIMRLAQGKK